MSIVVQEVTRIFGNQKALDNVSFEVKTGEIVGFIGPNGAGKSTMMKIITGFIPSTSGSVKVNGHDAGTGSLEIRKITGYLPENNPLYPEMYVREYLDFAASFYLSRAERRTAVKEIIGITGLTPEQDKKIGALSKGYRQRVGLAQALVHKPSILILDEATTGLDPNQIIEIRNLIRETGKDKTVMLSTHIMQEVEAVCDRVIIIDKGHIVANEEKSLIATTLSRQGQMIIVEFDHAVDESLLYSVEGITRVTLSGPCTWLIEAGGEKDIRPALFDLAVKNNLTVLSMQKKESNLEEVFRQLTGG